MNRIQVKGRRFGYKVGITFLAVKEYRTPRNRHGGLLSFAVDRRPFDYGCGGPNLRGGINRESIRALILQRMGASTKEYER